MQFVKTSEIEKARARRQGRQLIQDPIGRGAGRTPIRIQIIHRQASIQVLFLYLKHGLVDDKEMGEEYARQRAYKAISNLEAENAKDEVRDANLRNARAEAQYKSKA